MLQFGGTISALLLLTISVSGVASLFEGSRPSYLEGKVGSYVIFNCRIAFPQEHPIPYILHWNKNGKVIFSWYDGVITIAEQYIGRISLLDNIPNLGKASINISSIRESDGGWYQCMTYFPNRTPSSRGNGSWFHLSVDGWLMRIPPINQTVMEGEQAFFNCAVKDPRSMQVEWFKDSVPLIEFTDLARRTTLGPDGAILINPTTMSDLGEYLCRVRNEAGDEQTAKAYLNVEYKAKVIYAPQEVYFPHGRPALLDCHFRSNPPLTNLRWEKDGFLFDPYNVQGVFYKRNGSLYFNEVKDEHAGRYTCTPFNKYGTEGSSSIIKVIVQRPPTFRIRPKLLYITRLGDQVILPCDARDQGGSHFIPVEWLRKDGRPLPKQRYKVENGNLTVDNIAEEDRGIYTCVAKNQAATISVDSEIMIESVAPMAPYNVTANSSSTNITLNWVAGQIRSYLTYHVWYRSVDAQEWRTVRVGPYLEKTITNLEPATEYEFMILCQDKYGDGLFSKTYRFFTKPMESSHPPQPWQDPIEPFAQVGPPRNLTVSILDDGDFLLEWEPPDYGWNSFRLYKVRWWKEPGHIMIGTAETVETNYILKGIKEDEIYKFQVFSLSTSDYLIGSNEVEIIAPPYQRVKAITIGTSVGIFLAFIVLAILVYVKRNWFRSNHMGNEKI